MIRGFKDFIAKGNLIELAVAFVMGLAFTAVVMALVEDLITPIIAAIAGEPSFSGLSFEVNDSEFLYGDFLNAVITFLATAAAVYFFIVVPYERLRGPQETTMKECPECISDIPAAARRCPQCTAQLTP